MRYFKCVGYNANEKCFTLDKVYEAHDNGTGLKTDDGFVFYTDVDFLKPWYDFVEVNVAPVRNHTIKIVTDGRKTIAKLYDDTGETVRKAYCVCHEDDEYNFEIGADIAMKRLFDKNYARSKRINCSVGDKVEVFDPAYSDPYNISFFTAENIKYFNKFLYGQNVEKNAFGTVVAKRGTVCLIDKATTKRGEHYIIVDEKGLKKL